MLERATQLKLPHWYLAGGALSQTVWNHVSSLPPETGIRDYDLIYHDSTDTSYAGEDTIIQRGTTLFSDIPVEVEIRNQARVHLWYEKKYGVKCPKHESVEAGIDSWIATSAMLGVRIGEDGKWVAYAPRGLSDFFALVVRPNTMLGSREAYERKVGRWKGIWKDLKVEEWPEKEVGKGEEKGDELS